MKKLITTLLFTACMMATYAQIKKPSLSPRIVTQQQVGMVNVKLNYGQTNMQNRVIFGQLIPYNKVWRTGANASTKITFDREVKLANMTIPAGIYGLYTIPNKKEWTVIIHKNSKLWGDAGYKSDNDLIRFTIPVTKLSDTLETLTIHFENFHTNGGDLVIAWENSKVVIPLFVDSDEAIFNDISLKINDNNKEVSAQTYFEAAQFYYLKNTKLETAMIWFDKAIELKPSAFWYVYYKAELAYQLGDYKMAEKNAKKCLAAAKSSEKSDYGYIAKATLLLNLIASKG